MGNSVDLTGRPFHFIGIGGIGMSALAYVVAKRSLPVSGSDVRSTHITQGLQELGVQVFDNQDGANLDFFKFLNNSIGESFAGLNQGMDNPAAISAKFPQPASALVTVDPSTSLPQVICSTAIDRGNSELRAALEKGCPIFHRSDLLAALFKAYRSVAVAGTHGKTTTSSLIGYMLMKAGLDPTIVVGGEVNAWGGNARLGDSPYLVAEADESDGSLTKHSAEIGVITNIELDHPDHYESLEEVIKTFKTFASQCKTIVGSIDCPTVRNCLQPSISYSLDPQSHADYTVDRISYRPEGTTARVWERGEILGELSLKLLGQHNLSNALAAVAVGRKLGVAFNEIAEAIATFEGAKRRFEYRGESKGITFVDDYAHHPSEIQVTLSAARLQISSEQPPVTSSILNQKSYNRIVAIFQPHRYSRTLTFLSEFARSFQDADVVVITDIYSAGEPNSGTVTGQQVADAIAEYNPEVYYRSSLPSVRSFLTEILQPGDLALFLGAGNLNQLIPELLAFYEANDRTLVDVTH